MTWAVRLEPFETSMTLANMLLFLAAAQLQAEPYRPIFSCMLRQGKVDVLVSGNSLMLDYVPAKGRRTVLIEGRDGQVYRLQARYTGRYEHLRLARGENSFVIYSRDANSQTGIGPLSGLVVFKKHERIADHICRRPASFGWSLSDDALLRKLSDDSEVFSAF